MARLFPLVSLLMLLLLLLLLWDVVMCKCAGIEEEEENEEKEEEKDEEAWTLGGWALHKLVEGEERKMDFAVDTVVDAVDFAIKRKREAQKAGRNMLHPTEAVKGGGESVKEKAGSTTHVQAHAEEDL